MKELRQSPTERFNHALKFAIDDPVLRLTIRRIWETEMVGCSIFWDAEEHQIEFVKDNFEIIIRETP